MLNRKERRTANRAGGMDANHVKAVLDAERAELRKEFEEMSRKTIDKTIEMCKIAVATVLHDKEGFGRTRISRTLDNINTLCESMVDGYVSMGDCRAMLINEVGITIGHDRDYPGTAL